MYAEIHRHLVLYRNSPECAQSRFRQIVVVERDQFEVRVVESDTVQLDPKFTDDGSQSEIEFHAGLSQAVLKAEQLYKQSVKNGWRAYDPTMPHNVLVGTRRSWAA